VATPELHTVDVVSERRPEDDCYALSGRHQVLRPPDGLGAWCLDRADRHAGLFFERSAWVVGGHARDKLFSQDIPDCGERYRPLRPGIGSLLESGDRQVEFRFC
jgi:hypothetical protein